jgi:hemerythrin superfamily protein
MTSRQDAVDSLKADHTDVKGLFEAYKSLCERQASDVEKSAVAEEICLSLSIHAQVEEEIFYPAVRAAIGDDALMDEAQVEQSGAKDLIAQISALKPSDPLYDAKVTVLGEGIDHHVKEEHSRMFPKARKTNIDLMALGARLQARKNELMAEYKNMLGRTGRDDENADPVGRQAQAELP